MSDSTVKRVKVSKPEKKKAVTPATANTTTTEETTVEVEEAEPLIDIPAIKKKKERRVKTEADIAAKQERKRLRKEAEEAKKGAAVKKATIQNKTPKWKQFLKNSSEADNAEQLKDTSYKVKGDDGSDDDESDSEDEKANKKRKADKDSEGRSNKENKKGKKEDDSKLAALDVSTPGLQYLVEWKRSRDTWKFQKLRQVWLINNMYDDKQIPSTHWEIYLEYIHDLKGAARTSAINDAKKIVEAPETEEEEKKDAGDDEEMKAEETTTSEDNKETADDEEAPSTIPMSEEEKAEEEARLAAKAEAKRAAEVKATRAMDVLRVLA
ncbi:hypothetical protein EMPS_08588 [Entomortierella parvispora]|uniref:WKF domain-containing protein n=1 Tax=Entomortierella parvispora TaxID=205924 RepID=A0A9P3HGE3_9FUNG|nr:hypothetical protein EMPS_08588 [Entomortierella parvispora]